jgi:hypothetical protein
METLARVPQTLPILLARASFTNFDHLNIECIRSAVTGFCGNTIRRISLFHILVFLAFALYATDHPIVETVTVKLWQKEQRKMFSIRGTLFTGEGGAFMVRYLEASAVLAFTPTSCF